MKSKSMKDLINLYGEDRVKNIENDLFSLLGFVNSLDNKQDSEISVVWIDDMMDSLGIKGDMLEESIKSHDDFIKEQIDEDTDDDIDNGDVW